MRQVRGIFGSPTAHWIGDGFPVRSMFSHAAQGEHVSPFLLLDYAGRPRSLRLSAPAASAFIRIAASRPSRSSIRARSSIATRPAKAA